MARTRLPLLGALMLVLLSLCSLVSAVTPQNFCKCTCFKNSTIIPLSEHDEPSPDPPVLPPRSDSSLPRYHEVSKRSSGSCTKCNIDYCLSYNLPICKGADPKTDVTTMCFPRDTLKDRIIVWSFILGTTGLLGWAGLRRILEARERRGGGGDAGGGAGGNTGTNTVGGEEGGGLLSTATVRSGGGLWSRITGGLFGRGEGGTQTGEGGGGGVYAPLGSPGR